MNYTRRLAVGCVVSCLITPALLASTSTLSETEKIEALLKHIEGLKGATFIRNGTPATATAAANHLRAKWKSAGHQVKTAAEFIEKIASRSSVSGQPYTIRLADGTETPSGDYLKKQLELIEQGPATQPTSRP
jgi:Family of unknown function (DUF5329)